MNMPAASGAMENAASRFAARFPDLPLRIATAAAVAAIVGIALYFGGYVWIFLLAGAGFVLWQEWARLTRHFTRKWQIGGALYVLLPCLSLITLRLYPFTGAPSALWPLLLFVIVAATDIGAYFAGRIIGGPKLWPRISPNKTWAGLGGGVKAAIFCGTVFHEIFLNQFSLLTIILASGILALVAQGGDIFESYVKRRAGLKDSGTILPGHGGLLDRLDGYMFTAPLFLLLVILSTSSQ